MAFLVTVLASFLVSVAASDDAEARRAYGCPSRTVVHYQNGEKHVVAYRGHYFEYHIYDHYKYRNGKLVGSYRYYQPPNADTHGHNTGCNHVHA